ncbi:HD domain-containing protein [Adonisia turfae]|uniref:5'-deoxynucleotidase n=1 Tax=Adonisia turfae CCMR0081 TaxID=2292702 RepID=A0A6M0RJ67_9CYAN|nr:HD domain-containing protein [Adonisia turfae]NEZ56247.1 HD domain-containing protein [Adonisia turfae CCMR0081]
MEPVEIQRRLAFIQGAEKLKSVLRSSITSDGRKESTAEHTWRLCLLAMVFEDHFQHLDFAKVLKICILHDLGEAISGDIPAVNQVSGIDKSAQEREDLLLLMQPLNTRIREEFLLLWEEYENASTPEARAVKALDKIETLIQHNQGANPPDFDYEFNLSYGKKYTDADPLFSRIRALIDEETQRNALASRREGENGS